MHNLEGVSERLIGAKKDKRCKNFRKKPKTSQQTSFEKPRKHLYNKT